MNFSFPAWCWEEWQERLSPWRWGFQLTGTALMSLITRLPLASAAASLQPRIYIYLSCCHLYFRRSTTLSLLHVTHKFPWEWPAPCALSTLPSTSPHTQTYRLLPTSFWWLIILIHSNSTFSDFTFSFLFWSRIDQRFFFFFFKLPWCLIFRKKIKAGKAWYRNGFSKIPLHIDALVR